MANNYHKQFQSNISKHYDKLHEELKRRYSAGQREDAKKALELERFFNYLVYHPNDSNYLKLNNMLTQELANYILSNNPDVGAILKIKGTNSYQQGAYGEQGFAELITATVQSVADNPSAIPLPETLISGQELVTVLKDTPENVKKVIMQKVSQQLTEEGKQAEVSSALYGKFQQKTDIKSIQGTYSLTPGYEWLLQLSATVKNYTNKTISVGNTSRMKIMRATIINSTTISKKDKAQLLGQLNQITQLRMYKNNSIGEKNLQHFQHIQAIYDLIGIGQGRYENNVFRGAELPNFLMVNIQSAQRIVVRSTRQLVSDILKDKNVSITASGTRFSF